VAGNIPDGLLRVAPARDSLRGSILSDKPFAAMALAAMLVADVSMRPNARGMSAVGCAILVGVAILTRVLGAPLAVGIMIAGLSRRSWRQVIVFGACVVPFFAIVILPAIFSRLPVSPVTGAAALNIGWARTWIYYTSYLGAWKLEIPSGHAFWATLQNRAKSALAAPSDIVLSPLLMPDNWFGGALMGVVTVASLAGIIRQAVTHE
jgi:hypothetical protein